MWDYTKHHMTELTERGKFFIARTLMLLFISFFLGIAQAQTLLPEDEAFRLSTKMNPNTVVLTWEMAQGYHLYKERIKINALSDSDIKLDEFFVPLYETAEEKLAIEIPLIINDKKQEQVLSLEVTYQGCQGAEHCYPPITKTLHLLYDKALVLEPEPNLIVRLFTHHSAFFILLSFVGFGLLLSFTPCVLPMIPILSSIVLGQKAMTTRRAFLLSLTYVCSMAMTLSIAGMIVAMAGYSVQAAMQNPWVIVAVSLLFLALSLSLFGLYDLQLPAFLRHKAHHVSRKQTAGTYWGSAMMGVLSCLVVSPCVSAPLMGILLYISTTHSVVMGGSSLFSLGLGMGIPLLIMGTMGGKFATLLTKKNRWMRVVKIFFGVLMLCMAAWMASRLLPAMPSQEPTGFVTVHNLTELNTELDNAREAHKPVMIDFSAAWCEACHQLDHTTFADENVKKALSRFVLIRADVTELNAQTAAMKARYSILGIPTLIFVDTDGKVNKGATVAGYVPPKKFMLPLQAIQ